MSRTSAPKLMVTGDLKFVSKIAPASKENPLAIHEECTFTLILEMLQAPACQASMVSDWHAWSCGHRILAFNVGQHALCRQC